MSMKHRIKYEETKLKYGNLYLKLKQINQIFAIYGEENVWIGGNLQNSVISSYLLQDDSIWKWMKFKILEMKPEIGEYVSLLNLN